MTDAPSPRRTLQEADVLAAAVFAVCLLLTLITSLTLNPDGVAYLDLAGRARAGDWPHFVQGYWSPLYPLLIAALSLVTGASGPSLIGLAHDANLLVALPAIGILWRIARRHESKLFGRACFTAFIVCSARPPRFDAITPDLLLLTLVMAIAYELLFHGGRRWLRLGLWMGLAFLAKTSAWPWLLVALPLRLWGAGARKDYRPFVLSTTVMIAVMAAWIIPMSVKLHGFTLGSAGRLNYCWYLEQCDSRSPDTHAGAHTNYKEFTVESQLTATYATYGDSAWTYEPWSDPTAWEKGVTTRTRTPPTPGWLIKYWTKMAGGAGLWMLHMFLGALVPAWWLNRRPGMWRSLTTVHPEAVVTMGLGLLGVAQFIAVHAEPRLIAPYSMMFALGALGWLCAQPAAPEQPVGRRARKQQEREKKRPAGSGFRTFVAWIGLLSVVPAVVLRVNSEIITREVLTRRGIAIGGSVAARARPRVVVVGMAIPVVSDAYRLDGRVVAQVLPASADSIQKLPENVRRTLMDIVFSGMADAAWYSPGDGTVRIEALSKRQ